MKKLTLSQIAPYLPYKLNILLEISMEESDSFEMTLENIEGVLEYQRKPLLRPLSGLTEVIEIEGKKFNPLSELFKIKYPIENSLLNFSKFEISQKPFSITAFYENANHFNLEINTLDLRNEPYWIIQKLIEWHFDVFDLIEKGLAMDLNTVNNQTV
jgi:hypothetical protein